MKISVLKGNVSHFTQGVGVSRGTTWVRYHFVLDGKKVTYDGEQFIIKNGDLLSISTFESGNEIHAECVKKDGIIYGDKSSNRFIVGSALILLSFAVLVAASIIFWQRQRQAIVLIIICFIAPLWVQAFLIFRSGVRVSLCKDALAKS